MCMGTNPDRLVCSGVWHSLHMMSLSKGHKGHVLHNRVHGYINRLK